MIKCVNTMVNDKTNCADKIFYIEWFYHEISGI